jgi:hypothetical protein
VEIDGQVHRFEGLFRRFGNEPALLKYFGAVEIDERVSSRTKARQ